MRTSRERDASTSFFADWASESAAAATPSATRNDVAADAAADVPAAPGRGRRRTAGLLITLLAATATSVVLSGARASADPSADAWHRLRVCESSDNYSTNTGNAHYGAYQFDLATWRSVGGSGYPHLASPAEQDARALILYRQRGWQPWQCASILGLRPDGSAGSGYIGDIRVPAGSTSGGVPAFPGGSHWYQYGERSPNIKAFQDRMHARGFFPVGTGEYGPNTLAMVTQLQRLNGLVPNGLIGPNTWRLAWTGTYRSP
jgi:resuscitation-promoting factor RpfA